MAPAVLSCTVWNCQYTYDVTNMYIPKICAPVNPYHHGFPDFYTTSKCCRMKCVFISTLLQWCDEPHIFDFISPPLEQHHNTNAWQVFLLFHCCIDDHQKYYAHIKLCLFCFSPSSSSPKIKRTEWIAAALLPLLLRRRQFHCRRLRCHYQDQQRTDNRQT